MLFLPRPGAGARPGMVVPSTPWLPPPPPHSPTGQRQLISRAVNVHEAFWGLHFSAKRLAACCRWLEITRGFSPGGRTQHHEPVL